MILALLKVVSEEQSKADHIIVVDPSKNNVWDCTEDHGLKMDLSFSIIVLVKMQNIAPF